MVTFLWEENRSISNIISAYVGNLFLTFYSQIIVNCLTFWSCIWATLSHQIDGNRKRSKQSSNADQLSLETEFSIAICHPTGDKWQLKTLFLTILSTFVDSINVFDCRLSCELQRNKVNIPMIPKPPFWTCDVVTFSLVSWVRCGAWFYRFLNFALFLTLHCQFLMILFLPKFMINVSTLILKLSSSHF